MSFRKDAANYSMLGLNPDTERGDRVNEEDANTLNPWRMEGFWLWQAKQQVVGCSLGLKGWTTDSDSGSSKHNQQPTSHPSA